MRALGAVRTFRGVLRDFVSADQEAVRALVLDGLRARWGDSFDPAFNPDLDDIRTTYLDVGAEVVVVEREAELVGVGILIAVGEAEGRLLRISVAAACQRQGIATSIVRELVDRGRRRRMRRILVLTDTPWTSAVELYRACGFAELGSDGVDTHFELCL